MQSNFLSETELNAIGFRSLGNNVLISRLAVFINPEKISLGNNARIDAFTIISASKPVDIGSFTHIAASCCIFGSAGCVMSDFSWLSPRAAIFTVSDDFSGKSLVGPTIPERYRSHMSAARVVFEEHSGIGTNSTVLPGVTLFEGAIGGAHSLIVKDCEPWTIYAGAPAKAIKDRDQTAKELGRQCLAEALEQ